MSAEQDEIALHGEVVGNVLVKPFSVGRGENDLVIVALRFQGANTSVYGLYLHDHSSEASVRIVIHTPPLVCRIVAEVVQVDFSQSLLLRSGQNRLIDESLEHFWQYGDNIYSHDYCCKYSVNA